MNSKNTHNSAIISKTKRRKEGQRRVRDTKARERETFERRNGNFSLSLSKTSSSKSATQRGENSIPHNIEDWKTKRREKKKETHSFAFDLTMSIEHTSKNGDDIRLPRPPRGPPPRRARTRSVVGKSIVRPSVRPSVCLCCLLCSLVCRIESVVGATHSMMTFFSPLL